MGVFLYELGEYGDCGAEGGSVGAVWANGGEEGKEGRMEEEVRVGGVFREEVICVRVASGLVFRRFRRGWGAKRC